MLAPAMSSTRTASCLFCGRTSPMKSNSAAIGIDCSACGRYEVTIGAIHHIRADPSLRTPVFEEVRRQLAEGQEPLVTLEFVKTLTGR